MRELRVMFSYSVLHIVKEPAAARRPGLRPTDNSTMDEAEKMDKK